MIRRVLLAAGFLALLASVAAIGGWPDPGTAVQLLTGASSTTATVAAFLVMLCWLAVAGLVVVVAVNTLAPRHRLRRITRHGSLAVLAVGVTILAIGIARHADGYRVCCANATTTQQAEHLVH